MPSGWSGRSSTLPAHTRTNHGRHFRTMAPAQPGARCGLWLLGPGRAGNRRWSIRISSADAARGDELNVIDVKIAPSLNVGYINGVGDQVPPAIEQLGAKLSFIGPDELAWGDLSKYDVILTGVRAYECRTDLRAYNHRLLDYSLAVAAR